MSNLKDRKKAAEAVVSGKNGKKPKSQSSVAAAQRKAERRRVKLLNLATSRTVEADVFLRAKRKAKRAGQRIANAEAKRAGEELPFPRKPLPPEPNVFTWFDWARETGNVIHAGRRKNKYRLPIPRGAEIVAMNADGRKLVKLPLGLALDVFGKV